MDYQKAPQQEQCVKGRERKATIPVKAFGQKYAASVSHRKDAMYPRQQRTGRSVVAALDFMKIPSTSALKEAFAQKRNKGSGC